MNGRDTAQQRAQAEYERVLAVLSDPDYDEGPELPPELQADLNDPGLWAIAPGGRVVWNQRLTCARFNRYWRERHAGGAA